MGKSRQVLLETSKEVLNLGKSKEEVDMVFKVLMRK